MSDRYVIVLVLVALMMVAALSSWVSGQLQPPRSTVATIAWASFLFGLPLAIIAMLLTSQRWILMAAVMYGTVGLALDVSTSVQEITRGQGDWAVLSLCAVSGLLNLLLIILGGRAFLDARDLPAR